MIRFTDNILNNIENTDFVPRNRVPRSLQIVIMFLVAFDLICFSAYLTNDSSMSAEFLVILLVSISMLGFLTFFFINRFRKLILVTEFQTAMLASATQLGTRFCFIVNGEGVIFYVDPGFQKFFTSFIDSGNRTLKSLLAFTEVPDDLGAKIFASLKQNKSDHVILAFKGASGHPMTIVTTIDVIPRPKGYFIIRGRDYVEKRAADKPDGSADDKTLLAQALYSITACGILVVDGSGRIVLVNTGLEKWLGYASGEIVRAKLRVSQVFHQYGGREPGVLLLSDFDGEVIIQRKDGSLIAMKTLQNLLTAGNQTLGVSAVIDLRDAA